ncbi:MAG: hypothetical protein LUO82_01660 [Methanomicrobiales archaeon]|nr:hypothetical protein [Methanomicrobiales archaeon]
MSIEAILLPVLTIVILFEIFLMYLMHVRMKQLIDEVTLLNSKMEITDVELDVLTKNVEEFKRLQL